jgi:ADP-heptose:LPS heptosyltransferase
MLLWGPDEVELVEQLRGALGSGSSVAPSTTLPELVALTGQFRAYVGSDTAALHMTWLQGVPAAVFTGPKPQATASPLALVEHRILRSEEHYVEGLAPGRQSPEVTTEVTVEQVVDATRSLLAASSASA